MRGLGGKFGDTSNPLIIVEWILAIVTVVGATYLYYPALAGIALVTVNSPLAAAVASTVGLLALATLALFSGVWLIAGIVKRKVKWRAAALFLQSMLRLYALLAGILINGLIPLTWLSSLTLLLISLYIWGRIKRRGIE